jgi:YidC/Oxa1 family membrane protein insertase
MNGPSQEIDQKNLISAIALSVGILMIWQYFNPPPPPVEMQDTTAVVKAQDVATQTNSQGVTNTPAPANTPAARLEVPLESYAVENTLQKVTLANRDATIQHWVLKNEQYAVKTEGKSDELLELVSGRLDTINQTGFVSPVLKIAVNGQDRSLSYGLKSKDANQVTFDWVDTASSLRVERRLVLKEEQHRLDTELILKNTGTAPVSYGVSVELQGVQDDENAQGSMFMPPLHMYESLCKTGGGFERLLGNDIVENVADGDPNTFTKEIAWAGIGTRYFLSAVYSPDGALTSCASSVEPPKDGFTRFTNLVGIGDGLLQPGETITRKYSVFMGPKKLSELSSGPVSLEDAIDFGMFHVMCKPMLWFMHIFFEFVSNWGFAIILLTLLVKLITMPLTIKQYRSMAAMKTVQPQLKKMQEKYKDDKMRLQQEMMKLYKENQVNPLAGCLPMIIMMPIYFALYRTIYSG